MTEILRAAVIAGPRELRDHRLDEGVKWLRKPGGRQLRTGLSWADSFRPDALAWFDRQMRALEECEEFAGLCVRMTRRCT